MRREQDDPRDDDPRLNPTVAQHEDADRGMYDDEIGPQGVDEAKVIYAAYMGAP